MIYMVDTIAVNYMVVFPGEENECSIQLTCEENTPKECAPEQGDCQTECFNCPLLYVTTLPASFSISINFILLSKTYPSFQNDLVSEYASKAWKPPRFY